MKDKAFGWILPFICTFSYNDFNAEFLDSWHSDLSLYSVLEAITGLHT